MIRVMFTHLKDKLKKALLSSRNVKFGAFLSSLAAGFKVQCHV